MSSHMKVTEKHFSIKEIALGYTENMSDNSVTGLSNRLEIRPKYQRQFVYPRDKQDKVIDSILHDYPINVMYWVQTGKNSAGEELYEVLDGQQRLISICRFITKNYTINFEGNQTSYAGLSDKSVIDNYAKLIVYVCEKGENQSDAEFEKEKLEWFDRINIAGSPLTDQELLSALKYGDWTTSAKSYFVRKSESGDTAYSYGIQNGKAAREYLSIKKAEKSDDDKAQEKGNNDSYTRQGILEKVLCWKTGKGFNLGTTGPNGDVARYMEIHRNEKDAAELWQYFTNVINWLKGLFPDYNKVMQNVEWGLLYNIYHSNKNISATITAQRAKELLSDKYEIPRKQAVYQFVLDECVNGKNADTSVLNLRQFDKETSLIQYQMQHGICPCCGKHFTFEKMQADHIKPWSKGGFTTPDNCQMLCADCNLKKSNDENVAMLYSLKEVIEMSEEKRASIEEGHLKSEVNS